MSSLSLIQLNQKLQGKVVVRGSCAIWIAATDKDGYGRLRDGNRVVAAHRYAWELAHPTQEIPPSMCVARNPYVCPTVHQGKGFPVCINPDHLGVYSKRDILLRSEITEPGKHKRQLRCKRNHPFTVENTYIYNNERRCRRCQKLRQKIKKEAFNV